jgi:hypothetical protein
MNITLLAELTCLTKLVNGKVVVINLKDNTYKTYNRGMYTPTIPQEFNPEDYALLETRHCPVVIEATPMMKETYLVNKLWREQAGSSLKYKSLNRK